MIYKKFIGRFFVLFFIFLFCGFGILSSVLSAGAAGDQDTAFESGLVSGVDYINKIVIQTDGKVLLSGTDVVNGIGGRGGLVRLNADGTLDSSFNLGTGFNREANAGVNDIALQGDGRIIVAGNFTEFNGTAKNMIVRLNTDGSIDSTFDSGAGPNVYIYRIALRSDGKIYISGSFTSYDGTAINDIALLNSDGSLDTSFDPGTGIDAGKSISSMATGTDSKLIIGGTFTSYNGTARKLLVRINTNGTIDADFNNGTAMAGTNILKVTLQTDQKILIGGTFTSYGGTAINRIARINTDGTLDTDFNPGTGVGYAVYNIAVQTDGKIVLVGQFTAYNGTARNQVARVSAAGVLDATFDPGVGPDANTRIDSLGIQTDNKVILGGTFTTFSGSTRNCITRVNDDGTLDTTYMNGLDSGLNSYVNVIRLISDGRIATAGEFTAYGETSRNRIAILNSDGSLDTSFDPGTGFDDDANDFIWSIAVQTDKKIIAVGEFTDYNGTGRNYIVRINTDGSLDTTFDPGTGADDVIYRMVLQGDGKIIIAGDFTSYNDTPVNYIARLNTDGSLDTDFTPASEIDYYVEDLLSLQSDGKILVGLWSDSLGTEHDNLNFYVVRLNTDGTLDATFDAGTGLDNPVNTSITQTDGKIILGGEFTTYNEVSAVRLVRLNSNGTIDNTFSSGTGPDNDVDDIKLTAADKFIIAGYFNFYNDVMANGVAMLNADGSLTDFFGNGIGVTGSNVASVAIQTDGDILLGGDFTTYDKLPAAHITRVLGSSSEATATPTPEPEATATPAPTSAPASNVMLSNNSSSGSSSNPSASSCNDTKPASAPDLFQIDVAGSKAKLFFTPIVNTNNYYVSFSTKTNAEEHSVDISLARAGVQDFTVNLLKPNTIYYFKVRGQIGCMPGSWSNVMRVKTRSLGSTTPISYYKSILSGWISAGSGRLNSISTTTIPTPEPSVFVKPETTTVPEPVQQTPKRCFLWWCW